MKHRHGESYKSKILNDFSKIVFSRKTFSKIYQKHLVQYFTIIVSNCWICFGNIRNKIDYKNRNILITEGDFNLQLKRWISNHRLCGLQGFILDAILFLLYINYLPVYLNQGDLTLRRWHYHRYYGVILSELIKSPRKFNFSWSGLFWIG